VFHISCPGHATIRTSRLGRGWAAVGSGWALVGFWSSHRDNAGIQESGRRRRRVETPMCRKLRVSRHNQLSCRTHSNHPFGNTRILIWRVPVSASQRTRKSYHFNPRPCSGQPSKHRGIRNCFQSTQLAWRAIRFDHFLLNAHSRTRASGVHLHLLLGNTSNKAARPKRFPKRIRPATIMFKRSLSQAKTPGSSAKKNLKGLQVPGSEKRRWPGGPPLQKQVAE
jgi:hypothetical protein